MRLIFGLIMFLGVGLAGLAVSYAKQRLEAYRTELARSQREIVETVDIAVAIMPLAYGQELNPSHVKFIRWPAEHAPMGGFTSMDQIFPPDAEGPRIVLRAMEFNEPLSRSKITEPGQDAGVASRLGTGMRAFSLSVDVTTGVAGFIRPSDRVDVYWTGRANGENVTRLIQSNLQIIAVDQQDDQDSRNPVLARTITVEAAPDRIAALAQAQATGTLSLALVGVMDETESAPVQVNERDFLGLNAPVEPMAAAEPAPPAICTVRARRGSEVTLVPVPCATN